MSRRTFWRTALAVPATVALSLGGVLLAAVPASAADFEVIAPESGSTLDSRIVEFTGTGTDGATVAITDVAGDDFREPATSIVEAEEWSVTIEFFGDAALDQSVLVTQTTDGAPSGEATVALVLPAPDVDPEEPTLAAPVIVAPTAGETVYGTEAAVAGTALPGNYVIAAVSGSEGEFLEETPVLVAPDGTWVVTFPVVPGDYEAYAIQLNDVEEPTEVSLPAGPVEFTVVAQLPAPVITAPTEGQTIVGEQVTFEGTGVPGAFIGLIVVPTELLEDVLAELEAEAEAEFGTRAVPADPADPIVVGADGRWSVTLALAPEEYTVIGIQSLDATGLSALSPFSAPVSFTLAAATAPALLPPTGSGDEASAFLALGSLLALAGAALIVVTKRRRVVG